MLRLLLLLPLFRSCLLLLYIIILALSDLSSFSLPFFKFILLPPKPSTVKVKLLFNASIIFVVACSRIWFSVHRIVFLYFSFKIFKLFYSFPLRFNFVNVLLWVNASFIIAAPSSSILLSIWESLRILSLFSLHSFCFFFLPRRSSSGYWLFWILFAASIAIIKPYVLSPILSSDNIINTLSLIITSNVKEEREFCFITIQIQFS